MAFQARLEKAPHPAFRITQDGNVLIVDNGLGEPIVQELDTAVEAKQRLLEMVESKQKNGYVVLFASEISTAESLSAREPRFFEIDHKDGSLRLAFVRELTDAGCQRALDELEAASPTRVRIICREASPGVHWERAIAGRTLDSLEELVFDTGSESVCQQQGNQLGDLAVTLAALPALERLSVTGTSEVSGCRHDRLSKLCMLADPMLESQLDGLGRSVFPSLERLVLTLGSENPGPPATVAVDAIRSLDAPSLRELHICGGHASAYLEALDAVELPKLRRLAFYDWDIDEQALLTALGNHADVTAALDELLIQELSDETLARARALAPNLVSRELELETW